MSADTRGIRELAEKWRHGNLGCEKHKGDGQWYSCKDWLVESVSAFAESIVEQCAQIADRTRMNGISTPREAAERIAHEIRSRWQRGEQV